MLDFFPELTYYTTFSFLPPENALEHFLIGITIHLIRPLL